MKSIVNKEKRFLANNYAPLPVVIAKGRGALVWDIEGKEYIDMMSAYSAVSLGHCHPRIVKTVKEQVEKISVLSRAYYSDRLAPFAEKLCAISGMDKVLPMNSGAEAVETAIKAARRWGYRIKGIPESHHAEIIVAKGNFHGRTTTIISFSTEESYRHGFGPFTPGFVPINYGDASAVERAITPNTCAVLLEPVQGEAGIIVPPAGYLRQVREICDRHHVLLIVDEVQTGLARTGKMFAFHYEGIKPDGLIVGKALGGGVLAISAFLATNAVMDVFNPGSHGSTFGGNPLAAAVALETMHILEEENLAEKAAKLGKHLMTRLRAINSPVIKTVRGLGLLAGVEVDTKKYSARDLSIMLINKGVLTKDTHETVLRFAPPLVIDKTTLDRGIDIIEEVLS